MTLPGITVSSFTDDHKLGCRELLATKFGVTVDRVQVTVGDAHRRWAAGSAIMLRYHVTELSGSTVSASIQIVEEIIGEPLHFADGLSFASASLAVPANGSWSVSYMYPT